MEITTATKKRAQTIAFLGSELRLHHNFPFIKCRTVFFRGKRLPPVLCICAAMQQFLSLCIKSLVLSGFLLRSAEFLSIDRAFYGQQAATLQQRVPQPACCAANVFILSQNRSEPVRVAIVFILSLKTG